MGLERSTMGVAGRSEFGLACLSPEKMIDMMDRICSIVRLQTNSAGSAGILGDSEIFEGR